MEIDTGASVSIILEQKQRQLFPNTSIVKSPLRLQTYMGEKMAVIGQMETKVKCSQQSKNLVLYVVAGNGPTLLGRNWLEHIQLDWKTIRKINAKQPSLDLHPNMLKSLMTNWELFSRLPHPCK